MGDKTRLRQIEIAAQWDAMEYALQQRDFWYFLTGGDDSLATRIEFLFRIMVDKPNDKDVQNLLTAAMEHKNVL